MGVRRFQKYRAHRGTKPYDEFYGERSYRTIFHHDRAEVTYSPFFRRMAFREYHIAEPGCDNRTRLLHSIEVATIASGMARRLGLDVDLAEAIALGHDIAQPPCGYPANSVLDKWLFRQDGFNHGKLAAQVLRWHSLQPKDDKRFTKLSVKHCYDKLKRDGKEFVATISQEALDGIAKHTPPSHDDPYGNPPGTVEGQIVRMADNLSYLSQEIEEGLRLDESHLEKLRSFRTPPALCNSRTGENKTKEDLLGVQPGCPRVPLLLDTMFGKRLGPRLVLMIKRIESYNKARLAMGELESGGLRMIETEMCDEGRIPVLEYDPSLKFVIGFLWDEFIVNVVNRFSRVKDRIEKNRNKINAVLEARMDADPMGSAECAEFEARMAEVKYYSHRGNLARRRRAVANHVALLTTPQIDSIVKVEGLL